MYIKSNISNMFDGRYAYIYVWISKKYAAVYVGQTNGAGGVIARGHGHVGVNGTLRVRFFEAYAEHLENADDWVLLSFRLPHKKNYTSAESSFRLAVEYLVQSRLNEIRGDLAPPFRLISNITYTDHCSYPEVVKISQSIIDDFLELYREG